MAFGINDVANWEEWNEPECDSVGENNNMVVLAKQEPVCGTTQYLGEGGGAGGGKPNGKRNKNKKNKLPGVSASQKSVTELFKLVQTQDQISHGSEVAGMDELSARDGVGGLNVVSRIPSDVSRTREKVQETEGGEGVSKLNSEMVLRGGSQFF